MFSISPKTKTLICIGTGGVGKTTMATSLAFGFANVGKKVLVLTIDPSLRLAQTLNIKTDGEIYPIKLTHNIKNGSLSACVINHKMAFDYFIQSATTSNHFEIESLTKNRLYQQLSGRLSGSQDFTSLIMLQRYVSSGDYDLIILDTPPSQHTWNFLKAPEKISHLFNDGIAKWFRDAGQSEAGLFKKILNIGTTQVLKALETLTGSQFIKELSAFFVAIQKWQAPLENYVSACHRTLVSIETEFVLVTALDPSRLTEAEKLSREIKQQGYRLTSIIINRVPNWLQNKGNTKSKRINDLINYYQGLENNLYHRIDRLKNNLNIYKCNDLRQTGIDDSNLQEAFSQITKINF